jgi:hypothetical protein
LRSIFEVGEEGLERRRNQTMLSVRCCTLTGKFFAVTGGDGRGVIVEKVLDLVMTICQALLIVVQLGVKSKIWR